MAGEGEPSEKVQNYLDKHKISSLFQDLRTKIIKDLPVDPIDFLISKLQALKQKKKGAAPRPATSGGASSLRTSRIQVTGTTAPTTASKLKSPSAAKSRAGLTSTSSPSLTKTRPTTAGTKTVTTKSAAGAKLKPPTSTLSPKRPTTAPVSGKSSLSSPSKPTGLKPPSKLSTSSASSSAKSTPTKTASRPGLRPPTTGSKASPGAVKKATTLQSAKDKPKSPIKKPANTQAAKKPLAKEDPAPVKTETSAEKIAEFFGEPQKTSIKSTLRHHDDDEVSVPNVDSGSEGGDRGEDEETCDCSGINLNSLLQMKMSMKQAKSKRSPKRPKSHLSPREEELSTTPPSLGYHSDGCEESEDECVEAVEDAAALEDEGVTGLPGNKLSSLPKDTKVDFMVLLCARCAKMLTGDEPITEMSAIIVTKGAGSDFESASQVGSHASFPQWEVGTEVDSEASSADKRKGSGASSNITLVSQDTWGGLAPKSRPLVPGTSDTESEVQLPPPPPLVGHPWKEDSPTQDPHGWAEQ